MLDQIKQGTWGLVKDEREWEIKRIVIRYQPFVVCVRSVCVVVFLFW